MRETVFRSGCIPALVGLLLVALLVSPVAGAGPGSGPAAPDDARADAGATGRPAAVGTAERPAQVGTRPMNITNVSADGAAVVQSTPETVLLWPSSGYNLSVTVNTTDYEGKNYVNLCVAGDNGSGGGTTGNASCVAFLPETTGQRTIHVPSRSGSVGPQTLSISVRNQQTNETLATERVSVVVVRSGDDYDSDLLSNGREIEIGTNLAIADTDRDGLDDGAEVDNYGTDPLSTDTDGDSLLDGEEVNGGTNATLPDTDGDGLDDGAEVNDLETSPANPDTDGDGLSDGSEVREYESSPTDPDTDDDGLSDGMEVEVYGTNPVSAHTDGDRLADGTEIRLGTNPTNPWTGVWILGLAVGAVVVGALVIGRAYGDRLEEAYEAWRRTLVAQVSAADDGGDGGPAAAPTDQPPPDWNGSPAPVVKTDEDRIMELLYGHEGRLHQHELVERTDWSASKVSRLLSSMAEEGLIEKIRLGRKNVVTVAPDEGEADDGSAGVEGGESDGREADDPAEVDVDDAPDADGGDSNDPDDDSNGRDGEGKEGTYA